MLKSVLADYESHEIEHIEFHWTDGRKAGIGNKEICNLLMETAKRELKRQIKEYSNQ